MTGKSDTILYSCPKILGLVGAIDWCLLEQIPEYQLGLAANSKGREREN